MRRLFNYRVVAVLVLVLALALFAAMNRSPVLVWPFGRIAVFWLIVISFAAGLGVGMLGHSLLSSFRGRSARQLEGVPSTMRAGEREHPGRP
jgi:hypothetical protein